jgi:putative acetyltransferase
MKHHITNAKKQDYQALIKIWEDSVKATHHFLPEEEIPKIRSLILNKYFDNVTLKCAKDKNSNILGFIGISSNKIEMLFISPSSQGKGIGSELCQHAIIRHKISKVDVNEQNLMAKKFYEKMGFIVIGRSPLDEQGRPYPILHMEIGKT